MVGESTAGDTKARYWRLKLGDDWTVPVVELYRGTPQGTSCIVADSGRTAVVDQIESLLSEKSRVLAIDPFYLGESKLAEHGDRLALFVSSVGARPLGVQADQLQSVTRWAATQFGEPVKQVVAIGPRITLAALVAAAAGTDRRKAAASCAAWLARQPAPDHREQLVGRRISRSYSASASIRIAISTT